MKTYLHKTVFALTLLALVAGLFLPVPLPTQAAPISQEDISFAKARILLTKLSAMERVGQLFLITFKGSDLRENSAVYQLISQYHVGGVLLSRQNENFDDRENLTRQVFTLTTGLQQIEYTSAQPAGETAASAYIPLFIALSQEGGAYPTDQLLSGVTPLPSLMTLGAAWNPDYAFQTGQAMGSEITALGFNLLLSPSLDVVDGGYRAEGNDLGVRAFGGDPYWVSRLGQAYISGLHAGSDPPRLAVVAKHFPGIGDADRDLSVEIPTVRKSLDQLKRIELAPFFSVTGQALEPSAVVDGLYLSHIRYQGFQGNIRDISTRPISFDQGALNDILKLEPIGLWRANGGILVSDNLGSQALRRFFDPSGSNFDARQVARNALMAGNDLLFTDGLISSSDPDELTTLTRTIEFFTQTYREDAAFAQRVDTAVERILALKYRLYPELTLETVLPAEEGLSRVGTNANLTYQAASSAATLISPSPAELVNILSHPPAGNERIVFLTDEAPADQCTLCEQQSSVSYDALQSAVLRLYGTSAGGPISRNLLQSYSFADLSKLFLQQPEPPPVEESLQLANWVVVLMQNEDPTRPDSLAFQRLLSERPELVRNKRLVVFALGAPYYLDATDIAKLSAYYALYGKAAPYIDLAARILFQEHIPSGASPVSIPGTGYDLLEKTRPNPDQVITLSLDEPAKPVLQGTADAAEAPTFKLGDILRLRTDIILDHNNHQVPDGTVVRFLFSFGDEPGLAQIIEAQTVDGVARAAYKIERGQLLEITATSDPALNSTRLILDITSGESAAITVIAPTPLPSPTSLPSATPQPSPTPSPTPLPPPLPPARFGDWALVVALALGAAALLVWLLMGLFTFRWAVRLGLCTLIGTLAGYNYYVLEMPGSSALQEQFSTGAVFLLSIAGALFGLACGWGWRWWSLRRQPSGPLTPSRKATAGGSIAVEPQESLPADSPQGTAPDGEIRPETEQKTQTT